MVRPGEAGSSAVGFARASRVPRKPAPPLIGTFIFSPSFALFMQEISRNLVVIDARDGEDNYITAPGKRNSTVASQKLDEGSTLPKKRKTNLLCAMGQTFRIHPRFGSRLVWFSTCSAYPASVPSEALKKPPYREL
jgi:hypothetical protein